MDADTPVYAAEQIPMEQSLFADDEFECKVRWPFLDVYNFGKVVPSDAEVASVLDADWAALLQQCPRDDPAGLFKKFAPELDQVVDRHRTVHHELPLMVHCGTTSYADTRRRQLFVEDHVDSEYYIKVGDMQTFQRDWWYNFKFPTHFPNHVTAAGEFHGRYHVQHADKRLNEPLIYHPFFIHLDIKGLTGPKLMMKAQGRMER